jgi:hypothetical protein
MPAITKISNANLSNTVFDILFFELDQYDVDAEIIAKGCADLARTIRERSQYERRNYYHNVSDIVGHLRCDPDLKLTDTDWLEFEQCSDASMPIIGFPTSEITTNRFIVSDTCFVITRLDRKNKPLELVYYSTK